MLPFRAERLEQAPPVFVSLQAPLDFWPRVVGTSTQWLLQEEAKPPQNVGWLQPLYDSPKVSWSWFPVPSSLFVTYLWLQLLLPVNFHGRGYLNWSLTPQQSVVCQSRINILSNHMQGEEERRDRSELKTLSQLIHHVSLDLHIK